MPHSSIGMHIFPRIPKTRRTYVNATA